VKAIGQDMIAGTKVNEILPDLNEKWTKAKAAK
jgi:hypothetical protein